MILPSHFIETNSISYFPKFGRNSYALYITFLLFIILSILSLPFLESDISIKASGITRPKNERTEIRPMITGIIDTIFYKEGDRVQIGTSIIRMKDLTSNSIQTQTNFEIGQRKQFIKDLELLTTLSLNENTQNLLSSPIYKVQLSHFLRQKEEHEILLKKATKEVEINTSLFVEKVISPKEFFDIKNNQEKVIATINSFMNGQQSYWQQEIVKNKFELSQHKEQLNKLNSNRGYNTIKSPTTGYLQGIYKHYAGGLLQANEVICTISPEGSLIGECYLSTKDIGLLKIGQNVQYRIDAFDYNYFGVLNGKVLSIDNDFITKDNKPLFIVRCSFDSAQLHLKNGLLAVLKKGLVFQASFIVTRRSFWQLLFDKLDDWLNPHAPSKS